ncbi:MAG: PD-(D/E)XK nuclease family protein [Actinobacteria bacterium]|nr:PD-(D/E)XK nuclease family protein [Actinomycetota bacterium]
MGLIGFKCCKASRKYDTGEFVSFSECISCAETTLNKCHFTAPIIKAMIDREQEERDSITVTQLSGCLRESYLSHKYDYYADPEQLYFAFRGELAHLIIERHQEKDAVAEQRFYRECTGIKISGRPDVILPNKKLIRDYKTAKEVPRFNYPFRNHSQQLNLYAWLVPFEIERLQVVYLDMKGVKICEAPLWSEKEVEALLEKKLPVLDAAFNRGSIPFADFDNWQCNGWCNVKTICRKLYEDELISGIRTVS